MGRSQPYHRRGVNPPITQRARDAAKTAFKLKNLPPQVVSSASRLKDAAAPLTAILAPQGSGDTQAKRKADRTLDNAWAATSDWFSGWAKLPPSDNPHHAEVNALTDAIFSDGLEFTQQRYKIQWQESDSRLNVLNEKKNVELIKNLGGTPFLTHLRDAHKAYGDAIHVTKAAPEPTDQDVRTKLLAVLDAIRDYATRVANVSDPSVPGSDALAEALLRPLTTWESPAAGS
ncbi:MAG: hypothetical protein IPK82_36300 [Polyangiaceae bacterium]|nr:hypothetical protein [Polyangiaceae bacterium]